MKRNFRLIIEYDGTGYCGWQRQPNGPSIQQAIETALLTMTRQPIVLIGSGRTDAGVHSIGQTANFICETRISSEAFLNGLNSLLPDDIVIRQCVETDPSFHARYDAVSKRYRYAIRNTPLPAAIGRQYEWWLRTPLDTDAMASAAAHLIGNLDFKSFEGAGSPRSSTIRNVMSADLYREGNGRIHFEIEADGFLRFMVRNIVGTLVDVGRGVLDAGAIPHILSSRDRSLAGAKAPAKGLTLLHVRYK